MVKEMDLEQQVGKLDTMLVEWGGVLDVLPPGKVHSGNVDDQIDYLMQNVMILPLLIELAINELVPVEKTEAQEYIRISDSLDNAKCIEKNVKGNQKNQYVIRSVLSELDIAGEKKKKESRVKKLEKLLEGFENLLWRYRKMSGK